MKALKICNLFKLYDINFFAINDISFYVNKGDFFALLCPNGAGKSTTIGILTSLIVKTYGKVYIFGYDLDKELMKIKTLIGIVPQEFNFNQFETVLEVIINQAGYYGISKDVAYFKAEYYLKKMGLWNSRNTISRILSGGMKRRLMIVRGLIHDPKILILDEPTAGVDIESRRLMWIFLKNLNLSGMTIILTTHYLEEVETLCNGVVIIDNGKVLEKTTVENLLKKMNKQSFILEIKNSNLIIPNSLNNCNFKKIDLNKIEVTIPKKFNLNTFFDLLNNANIEVLSMRNKANRLEELFIELIKFNRD